MDKNEVDTLKNYQYIVDFYYRKSIPIQAILLTFSNL